MLSRTARGQIWDLHNVATHIASRIKRLVRIEEFAGRCIACREEKGALNAIQMDASAFFENANAKRGVRDARTFLRHVQASKQTSHCTVHQSGKRAFLGRPKRGAQDSAGRRTLLSFEMTKILEAAQEDCFFSLGEGLIIQRVNS